MWLVPAISVTLETNPHILPTQENCQRKSVLVTRTSIQVSTEPCCGSTDAQLKSCMFFAAVGSTIRRCTKLYALSHLPWALERTAPTGWHARFGSPMLTTHFAPSSCGILPDFPLSPFPPPTHPPTHLLPPLSPPCLTFWGALHRSKNDEVLGY